MPKRIALKDLIMVDTTDLSNFARAVTFSSEHARIDVSGFSATGADEFLAGSTTQSVTVEFYGAYGTAETHAILYPIHKNRTIVAFKWRADGTAAISATNPELRGNIQILTYSPGATRGDADTYSVEMTSADAAGLAYVTAGP
jgi:predicted secreted protein